MKPFTYSQISYDVTRELQKELGGRLEEIHGFSLHRLERGFCQYLIEEGLVKSVCAGGKYGKFDASSFLAIAKDLKRIYTKWAYPNGRISLKLTDEEYAAALISLEFNCRQEDIDLTKESDRPEKTLYDKLKNARKYV